MQCGYMLLKVHKSEFVAKMKKESGYKPESFHYDFYCRTDTRYDNVSDKTVGVPDTLSRSISTIYIGANAVIANPASRQQ
jgi:hypothetical protein